jgi:DNA-binding GntR family transcriptional regulator
VTSAARAAAAAAEQGRPPLSEQFPEIRTPWKAIAAELRYAIGHDMAPAEPLSSLTGLSAMYGVDRKTARKALKALAAEGLIERVPGRPYRVPAAEP